ncbi:unnamed protein product [marine sediment metagenome]|uniref:Uncharacterized protein n=1 Tax=marine sediment metagenome TaxID=412755 RepID=X1HDN7_9ZZZZ
MREEAINSVIHKHLDGNSDCYPMENTVKTEVREYEPKEEGERLRKAKEEARKKRKEAKARNKARLEGQKEL